jgi:DNA-binding MarR family transcriptional regulator
MKKNNNLKFHKSYLYIYKVRDSKGKRLSDKGTILLQLLLSFCELKNPDCTEYIVSRLKPTEMYHFHIPINTLCDMLNLTDTTINKYCKELEEEKIIKKYRSTQTTKFWINYELLNKYNNEINN